MTLKAFFAWPLLRLKMMRVGSGFSVHSPFAYHFIIFCLRETLPYYAFQSEVTSRAGRRLFRVAAYFNPRSVCFIGNAAEARRVVSLVCPRAAVVSADADFVYVAPGHALPEDFRVLFAEDCSEIPSGAMTFSNGRQLIAVRRRGLPAQNFKLKF